MNAWYETPTKWYPLHIGVGSLLLVSLHWRKRRQERINNAEAGEPDVRIQGPWQVSHLHLIVCLYNAIPYRFMYLVLYLYAVHLDYGVILIVSNCPFGSVHMGSGFTRGSSAAT